MAALEIVSDPVKAHSSTAFTEAEALQVDFPSSRDRQPCLMLRVCLSCNRRDGEKCDTCTGEQHPL